MARNIFWGPFAKKKIYEFLNKILLIGPMWAICRHSLFFVQFLRRRPRVEICEESKRPKTQYIYLDSKFLAAVFYFTELAYKLFYYWPFGQSNMQHAPST